MRSRGLRAVGEKEKKYKKDWETFLHGSAAEQAALQEEIQRRIARPR